MKKGIAAIGCLGLIVGLALIFGMMYISIGNTIVEHEESASAQWANVESSYQRRADLIPNLVNTVKGYAEHERETLTAVIEARAKATSVNIDASNLSATNIAAFQKAQDGLSSALSKLLVSVERYPDLKANQNFLELQSQLEGTENRINVERNRFNGAVKTYNTYIKKFPGSIIAGFKGSEPMGYFKASEGSQDAPKVEF
jgi:LemA protein